MVGRTSGRRVVAWAVACVTSALLALSLTSAPAPASDEEPAVPRHGSAGHLMVVGDSISGRPRYGPAGDPGTTTAWWAHVLAGLGPGWTYTISAQAGSGMLNRGNQRPTDLTELDDTNRRCNGTTFGERLDQVVATRPTLLIVEGGRNDFKKCVKGTVRLATERDTVRAISRYLRDLGRVADSIGLPRRSVYVMAPWGVMYERHRDVVTVTMEQQAQVQGFGYIPLPVLPARELSDGTHPNSAGSRHLAAQVMAASDLHRFSSSGAATARTVAVRTSCSGYSDCTARKGPIGYRGVRSSSFWSQGPSRPATNFVAYRLTHDGRRSARFPGRTAAAWRDGARAAGVPVTGRAAKGAVAWWPVDPVTGSRSGHVAYVTKVSPDSVTVAEVRTGSRYAVRTYAGTAYPRGFLHVPRSNGSPSGAVTVTAGPRARSLRLEGFVTDPSRYGARVRLSVTVTKKGRAPVTLMPSQRPRFDVATTVRSSRIPTGRVTVRVHAHDVVGGGTSKVLVGRETVTVRSR